VKYWNEEIFILVLTEVDGVGNIWQIVLACRVHPYDAQTSRLSLRFSEIWIMRMT